MTNLPRASEFAADIPSEAVRVRTHFDDGPLRLTATGYLRPVVGRAIRAYLSTSLLRLDCLRRRSIYQATAALSG